MESEQGPSQISTVTRRKLLGGAVLAVGAAALTSCASSTPTAASTGSQTKTSLLEVVQHRGQLNVITQLLYPPEMYLTKQGKPAGYDVQLMNTMAKDLNVKLNIVNETSFSTIIPALLSGKGDIAMVGLVDTPQRALSIAFTTGYVPYQLAVMVPATSHITTADQLNRPGITITALLGSTDYFEAQILFPKATLTGLEEEPAMLAVATGRADAVVVEEYLAAPFAKLHPNVKILNPSAPVAVQWGCIGLPQGDQLWLNWLNNWIYYYTKANILKGYYNSIIGPTGTTWPTIG